MELVLLAGCEDGNCPRFVLGDPGVTYVQGRTLTADERTALGIPDGEDAVAVPTELVAEAGQRMGER